MSSRDLKLSIDPDISIGSLGKQIASLSTQICVRLEQRPGPQPSFKAGGGDVPEDAEYEALRASINDAALDLLRLVNGPKTTVRELVFSHYDLAALQVALNRGFFKHVPLPSGSADEINMNPKSSTSVAEIAAKSGMDEGRTAALLKLLASRRIFQQVDEENNDTEHFSHTSISASLAQDPEWHALCNMKLDDMFKASSELSAVISKSPYTSNATASAFRHRFGTSVYQYYDNNPDKGRRFAQAMSSWSKGK